MRRLDRRERWVSLWLTRVVAVLFVFENTGIERALLGGALRRALKAKTLRGRAEALLRVLKNRDLWVAYLARRIARGQTRIYSAHARVAKTLPPCHAEAQRAKAGPTPSKLGEELRVTVAPP